MSKDKNREILDKYKPDENNVQQTTDEQDKVNKEWIEYLEGKQGWQQEFIKWSLNQND